MKLDSMLLLPVLILTLTTSSSGQEIDAYQIEYHEGLFYTLEKGKVCKYDKDFRKPATCVNTKVIPENVAVFLVDGSHRSLLVCERGVPCEMRDLDTLNTTSDTTFSENDTSLNTSVLAGNTTDGKTIAFISRGGRNNETVLYTATRVGTEALSPLSVRRLTGDRIFQLFNQSRKGSKIDLVPQFRKTYTDNFYPVSGFSHDGAAYFVAKQIENSSSTDQISTLIQICQNGALDSPWTSYIDVQIECEGSFRVLFAVATKRFLLTVFEGSNHSHVKLCRFLYSKITQYLEMNLGHNLEKDRYLPNNEKSTCFMQNEASGCDYANCTNVIIRNNFRLRQFEHIDLYLPETASHFEASDINEGNHSILLVSIYNETKIAMYYIKSDNSMVELRTFIGHSKVRPFKIIDDVLFVLGPNNVRKLQLSNVSSCQQLTSASDCVKSTDPFCGWCRNEVRCIPLKMCTDKQWVSIDVDVTQLGPARIDSVYPSRGPKAGGTLITMIGNNLDLCHPISVTIGDMQCEDSHRPRNSTSFTCLTPMSPSLGEVNVTFECTNVSSTQFNGTFSYLEDPTISGMSPNRSILSGGRELSVSGSNFDIIQKPSIQIVGVNISEACQHKNKTLITCKSPEATPELVRQLKNKANVDKREVEEGKPRSVTEGNCGSKDILCVKVEFQMDGVNRSLLRQTLELTRDPVFYNFTEEGRTKQYSTDARSIVIMGERMAASATFSEYDITVGNMVCDVSKNKFSNHEIYCYPPTHDNQPNKIYNQSKNPEVLVRLGNIERHVGFLHYLPPEAGHYVYLYILVGILCLIVAVLIVVGVLLRRRSRRAVKKLQNDMQTMEMRVKAEFRQAFADLQTDMTDVTGELVETGLPYHKFPVYAFQILFPADDVTRMTSHKIFNYPETSQDVTDVDTAVMKLSELFQNKFFVLSIVDTLEQQRKLSISEKSSFASYLGAALMSDLGYFSQLVKGLLKEYITDGVSKKKHKLLFRRYESITEKLAGIWMSVCLHQHLLKSRGGSALIMMVKAIQTVMMKSPIDAVTDAARATLSYEQLLLCPVDNDDVISIRIMINGGEFECSCTVLGCDTISQVKAKCIGEMYKRDAASKRPAVSDVHLQWHCGKEGRLILEERDTTPSEDNCVKLMTLADYHVTDGALMELLNKHVLVDDADYVNYNDDHSKVSDSKMNLLMEIEEVIETKIEAESDAVKYHLIKPEELSLEKTKILPETHLHRLLQTKLNVKQYVDEALDSALDRKDVPAVVKFIFSELDELAAGLGVDNDTLLSWKNNCYLIRFWGMLISKPKIVFDIDLPGYVQPSVDIVTNTFLECFGEKQSLSKNSAPHKLLFYKDQEDYRQWVKSFHRAVTNTPSLDEREFEQHMKKLSCTQMKINHTCAFFEIYKVLVEYRAEIIDGLENDKDASRLQLSEKLENVFEILDS